jgi:drug/metabolite transporter (DMT)-like permease
MAPGDLFAIASAILFAVANITIVRGAAPGDDDNGAFLSLLITAGVAFAGWILIGAVRGFEPVTAKALAWFAAAGIFTSFIGRVFLFGSIQRLGAMRGSALKRFNPFFAVILGVLVLGERLGPAMIAGIALLVASFALLVQGSLRQRAAGERHASGHAAGYALGAASGLGYATGYLFRKMGLAEAPDPWLGAAAGSLFGAFLFVATARFNAKYARAVRATFRAPNPWLVWAGITSSFGQVFYFAALNTSPISRVALIVSMEVFVTLALGSLLLRRHETLSLPVAVAAALGVAGTALIVAT